MADLQTSAIEVIRVINKIKELKLGLQISITYQYNTGKEITQLKKNCKFNYKIKYLYYTKN